MTKRDMRTFVNDLVASVKEKILKAIKEGRIPEEWDGHELRWLLADKFEQQTFRLPRKRMREYRNTVLVRNL